MRFRTKFDRWIVVVLTLTAALTCVVLPLMQLMPHSRPVPAFVMFLPIVIWLIVLPNTLPQYYDVRDDGLFIRQGWRMSVIPYSSITEVQSVNDSRSAAVFSTDRVFIATNEGKRFIIAVAEEERFLDALAARCPQLDRKPWGLGMPLSSPSDL